MCLIKKFSVVFYILTLILLLFTGFIYLYKIHEIDPYVNYNNIKQTNCSISNIIYPNNLDSLKWENYSTYWEKCKCGKGCYSETAIQKIYVNYENNYNQLIKNIYYKNDDDNYTFIQNYNKKYCPASIKDHLDDINNGINKIQPYIELMNNNETFICYTFNNNVYIDKGSDNYLLISLIITSILMFIILISLLLCYSLIIIENIKYYNKKKKQNKINFRIDMDMDNFYNRS